MSIERPLVVLPTYDEVGNVEAILDAVALAAPAAEMLVVDDASPDGTADVVAGLAASEPRVHLLRRDAKYGLGSAYRDGFQWGLDRHHDALVQMDSDFQHDPAAIPDLLRALDDGADMAIGSRYVAGGSLPAAWGRHRKALSRGANSYARIALGLPLRDATAGFRAHRASFVACLDLAAIRADGYGFQIGLSRAGHRAGGRIAEVPIRFGERRHGASKMSWRIIVEAFVLVTTLAARDRLRRS